QAFTPLTTAATISFSLRVKSSGAIARFMARPWGPPNSPSHAMTRLMAGGSAKSYLNQRLESSKSFRAASGYSDASRSFTVGTVLLLLCARPLAMLAAGGRASRRPGAGTARAHRHPTARDRGRRLD